MNDQRQLVRVHADVTNPGHFFACCGLVELTALIWQDDLECWFADGHFFLAKTNGLASPPSLEGLVAEISELVLTRLDPEDEVASPLCVSARTGLRLDWWRDSISGGQALKTWAGSQSGFRIALAMQKAMPKSQAAACMNFSTVVYDPAEPEKKVEPFYFDSRRGARPFSRDIGFAPDALHMTTPAYPAVEFLCLIGLQRCRPMPVEKRSFEYFTWEVPLPLSVIQAAACGLITTVCGGGYRFENAFRTDQRKHKAFSPAVQLSRKPK